MNPDCKKRRIARWPQDYRHDCLKSLRDWNDKIDKNEQKPLERDRRNILFWSGLFLNQNCSYIGQPEGAGRDRLTLTMEHFSNRRWRPYWTKCKAVVFMWNPQKLRSTCMHYSIHVWLLGRSSCSFSSTKELHALAFGTNNLCCCCRYCFYCCN